MRKPRVYVAFDFDDRDVKGSLLEQAGRPDCPFELTDCSIDKPIAQRWPEEARRRIASADFVIVLCGADTRDASGVATELQIAQELGKRYFLLCGTRSSSPQPPRNARSEDRIWTFRWPTLRTLVEGGRPPEDAIVH